MKLLRGPGRGPRGGACRLLLLLSLLLGGLLRPERPLAAAATVVARQTDEALAAGSRPAVLPALLPGAEVAAPQPPTDSLPLPPALLPAALLLPAVRPAGSGPAARWRPGVPAPLGRRARLSSEVPNGP